MGRPARVQKTPRSSPRRFPRQTPKAAPPAVNQDGEAGQTKLLLSFDYGTKTLSLAFRIAKPEEAPAPSNVMDVHFSKREYWAPQKAAFDKSGEFYWGYGVEEALKKKKIAAEDVIELWKLLLYKDHELSGLAQRSEKQLKDRSVGEFIAIHLRAVIEEAKAYIKRSSSLDYAPEEIDALPIQLFLSVPQMWKAPSNLVMTRAAKEAGVEHVELVYEPQCAAAYYTHKVQGHLPKQIAVGDILLIADVGGGTGDFVSYEACEDSAQGASIGLALIDAKGALCGSELVNQNFLYWLQSQVSNFAAKCEGLHLSTTACLQKASEMFEAVKQNFSSLDEDPAFFVISGSQDANTETWQIKLTPKVIRSFFDPVVSTIIDRIDAQLRDRTTTLIVPGGFGRSQYLLDKLQERYSHRVQILGQATAAVGAYQPVSRGALLRYDSIIERGMPASESFGIAQVETWDPLCHSDATYYKGDKLPSGKTCRAEYVMDREVVEECPFDEDVFVVYERWCPILQKGRWKAPGKAISTETWQQHYPSVGDKTVLVQVYWTERDIKDHESIRVGKDGTTPLKKGIECWGDELEIPLPDLKALGFEEKESSTKGKVFEIYWRLTVTCRGANVEVNFQIAKPHTPPYDEEGVYQASEVELTEDKIIEICTATHSPFPRSTAS